LAASVRVVVLATQFPDIDASLCDMVVADLRRAGFFASVLECGAPGEADLTATASWYSTRSSDNWCTPDNSIGLALITAGIVPACSCPSGYQLNFSSSRGGPSQQVLLDREACSLFGWGPLFLNLKPEYHWRGPEDPALRASYLGHRLAGSRDALKSLLP